MNVIKFTDADVIRGLKGMTKARAPGWDEMHSEMATVAEEDGTRWTKRLLNTCKKQYKVPVDIVR